MEFFFLFVLLWFPSTRWSLVVLGLMMIGGGIGVLDGVTVGLGINEKGFSSLNFCSGSFLSSLFIKAFGENAGP